MFFNDAQLLLLIFILSQCNPRYIIELLLLITFWIIIAIDYSKRNIAIDEKEKN